MNERQLQQVLDNARRYAPRPLFDHKASKRVVRAIADRARQFRAVTEAWSRIAAPQWRPHVTLTGLLHGTLELSVDSPVLGYEIQRQAAVLGRLLAAQVAGVQRIEVRVGGV